MDATEYILDFLKETLMFHVEVQDRVLLELLKNPPNHILNIQELRKKIAPENTTGSGINNPFSTALHILEANDFIIIQNPNVILSKEGYKLFELLSYEEQKKPYTSFIEHKIKQHQDIKELMRLQLENERNVKRTSTATIYIAIATLVVSFVSIGIAILDYKHNRTRDKLELQQQQIDSTVSSLYRQLFQRLKDTTFVRILPNEKKP